MDVARIDLESQPFPWPDASMDVVVVNQVLEHLKNIWLPMNELHRVLRPDGAAILSVPNLASLHNRVLMALGRQPTSVRTFGPHVRGYTYHEFRALSRATARSRSRARPASASTRPVPFTALPAALWTGASHTTVIVARKATDRSPWRDFVASNSRRGCRRTTDSLPAIGLRWAGGGQHGDSLDRRSPRSHRPESVTAGRAAGNALPRWTGRSPRASLPSAR